MASRHLSLRIDPQCFEELEAESKRNRESLSELARRLIEEGLRMEKHPGIVFRPGLTGRQPALVDGPSVWVVARVLRGRDLSTEQSIQEGAALTSLRPDQVMTAARYYSEYKQEIDDWMDRLDEEAEKAYVAWLSESRPA
ncbi:MAG TPA: hypothetical protein VJB57_18065 [Dehalococcoidia bacterium]|nr:hypothetical protein [Dehalococcoidia bacterium]